MTSPKDNQDFYRRVDEICLRLRQIGLDAEATRISHRLHSVAWTGTAELFQELKSVFQEIVTGSNASTLTQSMRDEFMTFIGMLSDL